MAEWGRADLPYAERVDHLINGGGLNGDTLLNPAAYTPDAGGNTLPAAWTRWISFTVPKPWT